MFGKFFRGRRVQGDQHIVYGRGTHGQAAETQSSPMAECAISVSSAFKCIDVHGAFDVEWSPSEETSVVVHAEEHVLQRLNIHVSGETLVVTSKPGNLSASKRILVVAKSPAVSAVSLAGSGDIELVDVNTAELGIEISGSGDISATGTARALSVEIAGSGSFKGTALQAQVAHFSVAGSGDIHATVANDVTAKIMGSGDIRIKGGAGQRSTKVMGSGSIRFN